MQNFQRKYLTMTLFSSMTLRCISNIQYVKRDPGEDYEERILWGGLWESHWSLVPSGWRREVPNLSVHPKRDRCWGGWGETLQLDCSGSLILSPASPLMFGIGLRCWSGLWQGRESTGLHLGSAHVPTAAGQRIHDWFPWTRCGSCRQSHGSLNILDLPGKTGWFSVIWTSGGLGLKSRAARGMGCSLHLRGLAARRVHWGTLWG